MDNGHVALARSCFDLMATVMMTMMIYGADKRTRGELRVLIVSVGMMDGVRIDK
jgi:hypothetical protein